MNKILEFIKKRLKLIHVLVPIFILAMCIPMLKPWFSRTFPSVVNRLRKECTVGDRLKEFGRVVENRISHEYTSKSVSWPPAKLIYLCLKDELELRVYAGNDEKSMKYIMKYPILVSSGNVGPKLKEGDNQIPEGIYKIVSLNPNSCYHLSMKINYPNEFDLAKAEIEGRKKLGSDIFMHGDVASIGCISIGNEAIEDLFVLSALSGMKNIKVIISPMDLHKKDLPADMMKQLPKWYDELYLLIKKESMSLP
jgi:hypothetical protein